MSTVEAIAALLKATGPYGVAALGIVWGLLERRERKATQDKYDALATRLPQELLNIVRDTNERISEWTSAANAVLERRRA